MMMYPRPIDEEDSSNPPSRGSSVRTRFASSSTDGLPSLYASTEENEDDLDDDNEEWLSLLALRFDNLQLTVNRIIRLSKVIDHKHRESVVQNLKMPLESFRKEINAKKEDLEKKSRSFKYLPNCPLCVTKMEDPYSTLCGHICCRKCFTRQNIPLYTPPEEIHPPRCFICRKEVRQLIKLFFPE
jgi:hypothetical protein